MALHGNSHKNKKPHHLYEIWDKEEENVFKYGISDTPIDDDGLSGRLRSQLSFLNLAVGWIRFIGRVLKRNISGRKKAEKIEAEYINSYERINGRKPRGNKK